MIAAAPVSYLTGAASAAAGSTALLLDARRDPARMSLSSFEGRIAMEAITLSANGLHVVLDAGRLVFQRAGKRLPWTVDLSETVALIVRKLRAVLNVGDQDEGFLADELKRLNGELRSLDKSIRDLEAKATPGAPVELDRVGEALRAIDPIWDVLLAEEQRRIAQLLVEKITVSTSGIDIRFRTNGIEQIVEELQPIEERFCEKNA